MGHARARQGEIVFRTHGGKRCGAGRKPVGERAGVVHARRPRLSGREPVLVTLKMQPRVWNLRTRRVIERLMPALAAARERFGVRVVQFSFQRDHVHLLVEAESECALSRALGGLATRVAKLLNRLMERRGKVFTDRFHGRVLTTPRQVRNALRYVLCNARRHDIAFTGPFDPFSSAAWFHGWCGDFGRPRQEPTVAPARSWQIIDGFLLYGRLDPFAIPGPRA